MRAHQKSFLELRPSLGALALLGLVILAPAAIAQEARDAAPQETFEEQVNVTEVVLDALVTDRQGNVILGLQPEDFVVEENGDPVQLDSVSFYSNRLVEPDDESAEAAGVSADDPPSDRYFILFFHDQRINSGSAFRIVERQLNAGRQSQDWVREEMLPGDWVAVVSYDVKLKLHQDFTQDRKALISSIDRAVKGADGANWPSRQDGDEGPSLAESMPSGKELRKATGNIYKGLRVLAEATEAIQGRKNLMLFTLGFGELDSFGNYIPDTRYYPPMMHALNNANVAVYTIDLSPPNVRHSLEDAMSHLAMDTGGEYMFTHSNFIKPLRRVSEATNGYYLLSYRSRHPEGKEGYQKVKVSLKNPKWKVSARSGYSFGESSEG